MAEHGLLPERKPKDALSGSRIPAPRQKVPEAYLLEAVRFAVSPQLLCVGLDAGPRWRACSHMLRSAEFEGLS